MVFFGMKGLDGKIQNLFVFWPSPVNTNAQYLDKQSLVITWSQSGQLWEELDAIKNMKFPGQWMNLGIIKQGNPEW